ALQLHAMAAVSSRHRPSPSDEPGPVNPCLKSCPTRGPYLTAWASLPGQDPAITYSQRSFPTCYETEFVSRDLDLWAYANDVTLDFSRPGKPTDNGYSEAFNGKLRSECLNAHWFMDLAEAREKLEAWRSDYSEARPHSAIGYKVPIYLHIPGGTASPLQCSKPETLAGGDLGLGSGAEAGKLCFWTDQGLGVGQEQLQSGHGGMKVQW
ncbi:integrase-like protein, partial [Palleronia aestuarii]